MTPPPQLNLLAVVSLAACWGALSCGQVAWLPVAAGRAPTGHDPADSTSATVNNRYRAPAVDPLYGQ